MSKWKCSQCGLGFENFEARGFEGEIYCPLCYYKKLYKDTELEIERLNNIIKEIKEYIEFLKQTDGVILEEGINKIIDAINETLGSDINE